MPVEKGDIKAASTTASAEIQTMDASDVKEGESKTIAFEALDEAEIFLRDNKTSWEQVDVLLADQAKVRALIKKIDWHILPLLMVTYGLQLIDKTTLSNAAVFGLRKDTNLVGNQYSWVSSIFYFGYLFWEYPGCYLAQHFNVGKYCSIVVIIWGVVLMATAAATNFKGLMVCRFILGCLEAPITPCFMMIVSSWYDRRSQPFRAGLFYCCNGLGAIVGNLVFYGVGQEKGMQVYKVIFILCGGVTIVWGVILLWKLPDGVLSTTHYTTEEKMMVVGICKRNQTGVYNHHIKLYQILEAFRDPQLILCFFIMVLNEIVNGGYVSFGSLIIKSIVGGALKTTALNVPQGAFTASFIVTGTYLATRFKNTRCLIMAVYLIPSIIASFLFLYLSRSHLVGLLFANYIMVSYCATLTLVLQLPSSNLSGYTKRVTGSAMVFLGYCVGNIVGPQTFLSKESPRYPTGCKVLIACNSVQVGLVGLLYLLLTRRNKQRKEQLAAMGTATVAPENRVLRDITDFEDPYFEYAY